MVLVGSVQSQKEWFVYLKERSPNVLFSWIGADLSNDDLLGCFESNLEISDGTATLHVMFGDSIHSMPSFFKRVDIDSHKPYDITKTLKDKLC